MILSRLFAALLVALATYTTINAAYVIWQSPHCSLEQSARCK
jgi:hypothetical protein